eukprot:TRINITY_DN7161_c0_g1_i1.p1 TRINITY_DN7161_c0_g1~~TRINITY_DN7161_c0_g1_i1.p1  ORF type:complete len:197 (-),score=49.56 TRINITY_DN7161_c0_g1_i1:45-635(-)
MKVLWISPSFSDSFKQKCLATLDLNDIRVSTYTSSKTLCCDIVKERPPVIVTSLRRKKKDSGIRLAKKLREAGYKGKIVLFSSKINFVIPDEVGINFVAKSFDTLQSYLVNYKEKRDAWLSKRKMQKMAQCAESMNPSSMVSEGANTLSKMSSLAPPGVAMDMAPRMPGSMPFSRTSFMKKTKSQEESKGLSLIHI